MTAWDRAAWEVAVKDAGLRAAVQATALALAAHAGLDGVAAPGYAQLAADTACNTSTAFNHMFRLRMEGFIVREPGPGGGIMARFRLILPDAR